MVRIVVSFCVIILRVTLFASLSYSAAAFAGSDEFRSYRMEARKLLEEKQRPQAAILLLDKARLAAKTIADPYNRVNEMRYIGELYFAAGNEDAAHEIFANAGETALAIKPWYRALAAMISVLESQKQLRDTKALRSNAVHMLRKNLLERIDKAKSSGEIRRFFAALDAALLPEDAADTMLRLRNLSYAPLRRKVLYSLHLISFAESLPGKSVVITEQLRSFPPDADKWERALWYALLARFAAINGDDFSADMYAKKTKNILEHADGIPAERKRGLINRLDKQIESG